MLEYCIEWLVRAIVAGFVSQIPIMNALALLGMAGVCLWAYVTDPTLLQYIFLQPTFEVDESFVIGWGIVMVIGLAVGAWAGGALKNDFNKYFKRFVDKLKTTRIDMTL